MAKAALLSLEQDIIERVDMIKGNYDVDFVLMKVVEPDEAETAAREAAGIGADVILAYGLPPLINNETIKLPVVNITLSGQDIGILFNEAQARLRPQMPTVAFIAFSCMFRCASNAEDMSGVGIIIYMLDEFETNEAAVEKASEDGADIIISVRGVRNIAEKRGLPSLSIYPEEGLSFALLNTKAVSHAIENEKRGAAENAAILNSIFHGFIEVNVNGDIMRLNNYAKNLIDCKNLDVVGQPLLKYFPRTIEDDLHTVLKTGQQVFTLDIKLMNKQMITNIEPIIRGDDIIGAVIAMQKGQYVHTMTPETQSKVYSRGFKATSHFKDLKTKSAYYANLIEEAMQAANSRAPILICGEEGVEALRLAQCIHNVSSRSRSGFVEVDCGAWESEHLDEMLFGSKNRQGIEDDVYTLVELAEDGTLFLHHVDALKNELQFKICRLIRGVHLRNDYRQLSSNVRVIAATDKNLGVLMREGKFRNDLYYALNVLTLYVPSLRERKEDLEIWIDYFLDMYCNLYTRPIQLNKGANRFMCDYPWPGNIRQLENFCHRIVLMTPRRNIEEAFVRDLINRMDQPVETEEDQKAAVICRNKNVAKVLDALKRNGGNRTKTAGELGISKTTLWRLMQKYGITADYSV